MNVILGVTTGHDASACVLIGGRVASYALRERMSAVRHHYGLDRRTIDAALAGAGIRPRDISAVAITSTQLNPGLIDDADYFSFDVLVLLRHELECLNVVFLRAQQGHRDAVLTRATMRRRRMVAIESGM